MRDLLGKGWEPPVELPPDEQIAGFEINLASKGLSSLLAQSQLSIAEAAANLALEDLEGFIGCVPGATANDVCLTKFVHGFGQRAFRRPLTVSEAKRFADFYATSVSTHGASAGTRMLVESFLASPQFLNRIEGLDLSPAAGASRALNGFEIASRLSYLLWNSMPDEALFAAAESGALADPKHVAAQAERMLADPRAGEGVASFFLQWLKLGRLANTAKDVSTFADWSPDIARAMEIETRTFVLEMALNEQAGLSDLLSSPYSYMNAPLARFYGVEGPTTETFERVTLNPQQRLGLLTQGSVLATTAHPRSTNPVARGLLLLDRLLCLPPPPPPPGVSTELDESEPNTSMRARLAKHRQMPSCAACHRAIDGLGLALENYDAVGRWRDDDAGGPIDASASLSDLPGMEGDYDGPIPLLKRLSRSQQVASCFAQQAFRFAFARLEAEADTCTVEALASTIDKNAPVTKLFVALTQTAPFLQQGAAEEAHP